MNTMILVAQNARCKPVIVPAPKKVPKKVDAPSQEKMKEKTTTEPIIGPLSGENIPLLTIALMTSVPKNLKNFRLIMLKDHPP